MRGRGPRGKGKALRSTKFALPPPGSISCWLQLLKTQRRRCPGVFGQPADNESRKEQEAGVDRVWVADGDLHRTSTPTLAMEKGKLAVTVCKRVALPPAARRTKRELATEPTEHAAATKAARLKHPRNDASRVSCLDPTPPQPAGGEPPAPLARLGDG